MKSKRQYFVFVCLSVRVRDENIEIEAVEVVSTRIIYLSVGIYNIVSIVMYLSSKRNRRHES